MSNEPFEPETPPDDAYKIDTNTPEGAPEADEAAREPFPAEVFPGVAGEMIAESCRVNGVDADIPGASVLAAVAAALGKGLQIQRRGRRTRGNLHVIIAAPSGCGKSETARPIFEPLHEIEAELAADCEAHKPEREARLSLLEAEEARIIKESAKGPRGASVVDLTEVKTEISTIKDAMILPRLIVENITTERLATMLRDNREALASVSTECGDVINNLCGRYTVGREDEKLYLAGFNGDRHYVDRQGRPNDPVRLNSPCLTISWLGTPPVLRKLWANEQFRTGGLLPRILPVFSRSLPAFDDGTEQTINPDAVARWKSLIRELHATLYEAPEPVEIECSHEADDVFRTARNEFVSFCRAGAMPESFRAFATREAEQAIRIAINLHAMKYGAKAGNEPLDADTAKAGVKLAAWFLAEHRMALSDTLADEARAEADKLAAKLEAAGGSARMRQLKRWHFKEAEIRRIVEAFPERFTMETVATEGGGWLSVKIKLAKGCR